jgi:DNA-binding FrmR family transcriptional regulator
MIKEYQGKKGIYLGLKKAKSHLERIMKMIEDDKYCIDILQQTKAVKGLITGVEQRILNRHLSTCFVEGMKTKSQKKRQRLIEEIITVTENFRK